MGLFDFLKNKQKKNVSKMNTNEGIKNHSEVTDRISVTTTALPNENNINKIYSMKIDNLFIGEIILLDWLEETGRNYPIRIHSANPVGVANMRRIIQKNGWREV